MTLDHTRGLISFVAVAALLCLVLIDRPKMTGCAPSAALDELASSSNAARLKQMFLDSQIDAIRNYHEHQTLERLKDASNQTGPNRPSFPTIQVIPLTGDARNKSLRELFAEFQNSPTKWTQQALVNSSNGNDTSNENDVNNDDNVDDKLTKSVQHDTKDLKNDARQSSLFPGVVSPAFGNSFGIGGGNTNPLVNGAFLRPPSAFAVLPTMPTMPSLHGFRLPTGQQQQAPRPPKTSVIGNGGGSMAMTNDNVVVVNVLSGNY
jgi:hypothetical protein